MKFGQYLLYKMRGSSFYLHHVAIYFTFNIYKLRLKFAYHLFKKIYLFYIEAHITNKCSLKCRHCIGYIPQIEQEYQHSMSFDEYKICIDNILENIESIRYFRIMGGEPLLNPELDKIVQYTLEQKKIKSIWIVTNGTISLSENLVSIIKMDPRKKVTIDISNYSINRELLPRLKIDLIVDICNRNNIKVNLAENLFWAQTSPVKYYNRSSKENRKYYKKCASICVGVHNIGAECGLFPCMKAGILKLWSIGRQKEGKDYINLTRPISKEVYFNFYSNNSFDACGFCNYLEDIRTSVVPAIQK